LDIKGTLITIIFKIKKRNKKKEIYPIEKKKDFLDVM